jgi:hypothetical protein
MILDNETKRQLWHKHTLIKINDLLDENFLYGDIQRVDALVRTPDNKWNQHRVDKAIRILDEYNENLKGLK